MFTSTLNIDIETFSDHDLKKCGLYKYAASPAFRILIFSYSINGGYVDRIDMTKEELPDSLIALIKDSTCKKIAWNAMFERTCIGAYLGCTLDPAQWECTMIKASMLGLPMSLEDAGIALNTDTKKAAVGKQLIRVFSIPCKPTKANGMRTRNLPQHFPEKWEQYMDYCDQDVWTEMSIGKRIDFFEIPERERRLYILDQQINDRGILVDPILIRNAIHHSKIFTEKLIEEAKLLTGLQNPKSVKQLREWLEIEIDETVPTLGKEAVHELIKTCDNQTVKRVLQIRQQISKTSIKKYDAMLNMMMDDCRIRGLFQFYGARTGRWAGRGVQVHNLYKNDLPDLEALRQLELEGEFDLIDMAYDTPEALAQLIRTALIASPNNELGMSDFSAIEARVLAWLAGEKWKLEVFNSHGKIYEATGANMFKVPIEAVTKTSKYRARAKVAELACGYQGGEGALKRMGAEKMGMDLKELPDIVGKWRDANKNIVKFWYAVEDCAVEAVKTGKVVTLRNLKFYMNKGVLHITLPSGRNLSYLKPIVKMSTIKSKKTGNEFTKEVLCCHTVDPKTRRFIETPLYGGLLVENIVQATSRDILGEKMLAVDAAGFLIVLHVHDEIGCDMSDEPYGLDINLEMFNDIMKAPLPWTTGLPLNADTTSSFFYRKD